MFYFSFRSFLLLVVKNVFEKLGLYHRGGANTSLVSDWLKVFLETATKYLHFMKVSRISIH